MPRSESNLLSLPDLSADDPDWETFDEIEVYALRGRTGLLARVLPDWAWDYWFAPTTVTPETLESDRIEVVSRYRSVINVTEDAEDRLAANRAKVVLDQTDRAIDRLAELDQQRFPASARPLEEHNSFASYLDEVATALATERAAAETSARLLAEPATVFLREAERNRTERAQTLLKYSIKQGRARRHAIARERRETITTLDQRLSQLAADFDQVTTQAQPYLDLEEYLDTDDIFNALKSIKETLSTLRKTHRIDLLSHPITDQIEGLETRVVSLRDNLAAAGREYAELQLEQVENRIEQEIEDLRVSLEPAREDGELIQSPEDIVTWIDDLRGAIQGFRAAPWRDELSRSDLSQLLEYKAMLHENEQFVEEKVRFDTQYKTHADRFREIRAEAAPYLRFEQYLTGPTRQDLLNRLETLTETVEEFTAETRFGRLSHADQERCTEFKEKIAAIEGHLKYYNQNFVSRQREACADFFTDIGPANPWI